MHTNWHSMLTDPREPRVQKLCPIFFSKADLDVALTSAHTTRQRCQTDDYLKEADECRKTYTAECAKFAAATDDKAKKSARERLERAQAEEEQLREKARQVSDASLPKVCGMACASGGCLSVLVAMCCRLQLFHVCGSCLCCPSLFHVPSHSIESL